MSTVPCHIDEGNLVLGDVCSFILCLHYTMKRIYSLVIMVIFAILLLASSASAFSFFGMKPAPVCAQDSDIEKIMAEYDDIYVSQKVLTFVNENNYNDILLTIKRDRCKHIYHIQISDEGKMTIDQTGALKDAIKVSTTYTNVLKAQEAYSTNNIKKLISCAIRINAPISVWYNSFWFLKSYL